MRKKNAAVLCGLLALSAGCSHKVVLPVTEETPEPGIVFEFADGARPDSIFVSKCFLPADTTLYIDEYMSATTSLYIPSACDADAYTIALLEGDGIYKVKLDGYPLGDILARPDERIRVSVRSLSPLRYDITGSPLYDLLPGLRKEVHPLSNALSVFNRKKLSPMQADSLSRELDRVVAGIIERDSAGEATVALVALLDDEFAARAFDRLGAGASNTLSYTLACCKRNGYLRSSRIGERVREGNPYLDFTMRTPDGGSFTLSSVIGKWVVLDFWATWCRWCIIGFDDLRKAHEKYGNRLEIVGISCGDQDEAWLEALDRYGLPWTNVLGMQGDGASTVGGYPVKALPTKVIIDPEGIIRNITVGEDPKFYETLDSLMTGQ